MRISILLIVLIGFLSISDTDANPGNNQRPAHMADCATLKNSSNRLYGLCVAFCSSRDQSNVDLNDIASVKAAAPDIATLRKYNALKKLCDPDMPCFQIPDPGEDPPDPGEDPPPPAQCPCWSGAELASIDGDLPAVDGFTSGVDCTSHTDNGIEYLNQVVEGYEFLGLLTAEGTAWASIETANPEPYNGCFFSTINGQRNFPLESADANSCVQEIANHCTTLGNP